MDRAAKAEPAVMSHRYLLAHLIGHVADLLWKAGNYSQAKAELGAALAIQQNLADANPAVTSFQLALAGGYSEIGHVLRNTGKPAEALAEFGKALVISQKLADANPATTMFQMYVAGSCNSIGLVLSRTGNPSGGWRHNARRCPSGRGWSTPTLRLPSTRTTWPGATSRSAICSCERESRWRPWRSMSKRCPFIGSWQTPASATRNSWGAWPGATSRSAECMLGEKRFAEAFTALDTALAIYQKSAGSDPKNTVYANGLSFSYANRGWARVRAGQPVEAAADLRRAIELWARLPHLDPDTKLERARR